MLSTVRLKCYFCRKYFLTKRAYFIFNKESGYNSFCSRRCHYKSKFRGKFLTCDNPTCNKRFYRAPNDILSNNYCSRSCAAIVNNQKYPKWPVKHCKKCQKPFRREGSPYCSIECGKLGRFKYTKEEIVKIIQNHHKNTGRVPAKRELVGISEKATHMFGSWNKAILSANLVPNRSYDHRMYKRLLGKAKDDHKCDSVSEILIDNWFYNNKIKHLRNVPYPNTKHVADWAVNNGRVFVEYFGLAKDSPRYDGSIKEKKRLCKKYKIKLIGIYPEDLYPKSCLDDKLAKLKLGPSYSGPDMIRRIMDPRQSRDNTRPRPLVGR